MPSGDRKPDTTARLAHLLDTLRALSTDDKLLLATTLLAEIQGKQPESVLQKDRNQVPYGIFGTPKLSSLEAITKYLKEDRGMRFTAIAKLTGRSAKTIWATYAKASMKMPEPYGSVRDELWFPVGSLSDRSLSVLEHVVARAKEQGYTNHKIALMLHLDDRTIWSVCASIKRKRADG